MRRQDVADNYWVRQRWARRRFLAGAGALGGAAFLAACGGGDDDKQATQSTPAAGGSAPAAGAQATTTTQAATNLPAAKIGGMIDRTGATANVGKPLGDGSNDFIAYANGSNLFGRKIDWIEFDNGYVADKGKEGYKKYVEQDRVSSILSFGTPITDAIQPLSAEDKIPIFTPGFGLGESVDGKKFSYLFIGAASYWDQAMALLGYYRDTWKDSSRKAKVYYLYYGNAAGRNPLELIKAQAPKLNLDLVGTLEVPATTTDMTQQMLEIKSKEPDFVMTHLFGAVPALSMKAAQQVGIAPEKYYSMVWGTGDGDYAAAGPAAENTYGLQFTALPSDKPEVFTKMQEWHARNGKTIDPTRLGDAVYYIRGVYNAALLSEGMKVAGNKERISGEDAKKAYESMKDFTVYGLSPGITFTAEDHGGSRKVRLYQFKGGKQNLVKDWFEGPKPASALTPGPSPFATGEGSLAR
jgi:branched-chain amino acid transport system substrate-binding protein